MPRTRVLVVEDSPTVRRRLVDILSSEPEIEVIGEAEDGEGAIEICRRWRPDVITMDMVLPIVTGLAATEYIMAHCPTPILVVSASTNRGDLFKTYEALAAGAVDVLEKPNETESDGVWERRFLRTVKLVARIRVITHPRARLADRHRSAIPSSKISGVPGAACAPRYDLVAIGASTGGPGAIVEVLRGLPVEFRLPVLLVQHINEPFGTAFADWLDGQSDRHVMSAQDGMHVASARGHVVVAPAGRHLVVRQGRVYLADVPERNSCRPSIDVLFESIASECGSTAIGCLLTGMGKDGALGLLKMREAGGMTIAQDESTSVIYGMPREAAALGAARHILRLDEIPSHLARLQGSRMRAMP